MKVGDFVRNSHHGLQRYGKVTKVLKNFKGDSWTYFDVEWVDDERYVKCQQWKAEMRGEAKNHFVPEYYRADDISFVDINQTLKTLIKLQNKPNAE